MNTATQTSAPVVGRTGGLAIEAKNLSVSYGSYTAVREISFAIGQGEFFALLGTNGAGKSSTMETLEGMRTRSGGSLTVLGLDPSTHATEIRSRSGIVLQEAGLADDLSVAETVELWLKLAARRYSARDIATKVAGVLADVGLTSRSDTRVKQLSGGQRRRLDIALAIVTEPELLFLDEPTTGLDPESRERVWSLLSEIHRNGATVVLTTHYLEEAERYAERIAIMHEGVIARMGTATQLIRDEPASIRFEIDDAAAVRDLQLSVPRLRVSTETRGETTEVLLTSGALQGDLTDLLSWANGRALRLQRLRASDASLADIFRSISEGAAK